MLRLRVLNMDYDFDSMTAAVEAPQGGMVTPPSLLDPCISQDFVFDIDSDFEMTTDAGLGNAPRDGRTAPQNVTRTSPPWLSPPRCGPTWYNPTLGSPPRHSPTWRGPCNCRDRTREPWTSPLLQGTRAAFEETWGLIDGMNKTFEPVAPLQLSSQTTRHVTSRLHISQDSDSMDSDFDFNSDIDSDSEPTASASGYVNAPQYGMTAAQNAIMTSPPWLSPPRCRPTWYSPPGGSPPRHSPTWHGPCSPPIMESQASALPAASSYGEFAEDLVCSVCLELFRKPVLLQCGHSFCQSCIDTVCLHKMASPCPVCRKMFAKGKYIKIVALDRLAEKVREGSPVRSHRKETCKEQNEDHWERMKLDSLAEKVGEGSLVRRRRWESHNDQEQSRAPEEKLEHFCKDDGSLACQDAPKHTDHRFLPMQDAGSMYKLELSSMASMFEKLLLALSAREVEMVDKRQVQEETAKKMLDCLLQLKEDCQKVPETLESAKRSFDKGEPLEFLKGIKFCLEKCLKEHVGRDPATGLSCTLSQLLSQVPIEYTILKQLQSNLSPAPFRLTLDPNTAHHELIVSEDRTSVWYSSKPCQSPHHHHKSFRACAVLASKGFTSGKHYWEVLVGNASNWVIGVAEEYVNREKDAEQLIEGAFWVEDNVHQLPWTTVRVENDAEKLPWGAVWALELNEFEILQRSGTAEISSRALSMISRPPKIRVCLDFNSGLVSFYDAEDLSLIRSMRFLTSSKIFPYFRPCTDLSKGKSEPLTLCY